jgi:hypothetical protein
MGCLRGWLGSKYGQSYMYVWNWNRNPRRYSDFHDTTIITVEMENMLQQHGQNLLHAYAFITITLP